MKNKQNNPMLALASATGFYAGLKQGTLVVDPYTRFSLGVCAGAMMAMSQNQQIRHVGIGMGIAGFLQLLDIKKGGYLVGNRYSQSIFALTEESGIVEIYPNEAPKFPIDGITVRGMNGVFKVSDGVYVEVNERGLISTSWGVGSWINVCRNAGLKSKNWAVSQPDKRWLELYRTSFG